MSICITMVFFLWFLELTYYTAKDPTHKPSRSRSLRRATVYLLGSFLQVECTRGCLPEQLANSKDFLTQPYAGNLWKCLRLQPTQTYPDTPVSGKQPNNTALNKDFPLHLLSIVSTNIAPHPNGPPSFWTGFPVDLR